jgi:hypothetical protein
MSVSTYLDTRYRSRSTIYSAVDPASSVFGGELTSSAARARAAAMAMAGAPRTTMSLIACLDRWRTSVGQCESLGGSVSPPDAHQITDTPLISGKLPK